MRQLTRGPVPGLLAEMAREHLTMAAAGFSPAEAATFRAALDKPCDRLTIAERGLLVRYYQAVADRTPSDAARIMLGAAADGLDAAELPEVVS